MITLLLLALSVAVAFTAALFGFFTSRRFVENRLRYVDAAQNPIAPFLAGGVAFVLAAVAAAILPFVGIFHAISFGVGVFTGVASGARENRRRLGAG
jgi:hypothetical protein